MSVDECDDQVSLHVEVAEIEPRATEQKVSGASYVSPTMVEIDETAELIQAVFAKVEPQKSAIVINAHAKVQP